MARQPRLALPGLMHHVLLRGHNGMVVFTDGTDRALFLAALRESLAGSALHGWALLDHEAHLLLRPTEAASLSRDMQALGRRFVAAYNRRHGRSGTPWNGRFRAAVVEPGATTLAVLQWVDQRTADETASSALGRWHSPSLVQNPPELWALGNTPFEREGAYRGLLAQSLPAHWGLRIEAALRSGRVIGSPDFAQMLAQQTQRRLMPGRRGRPKRGD